MWSSEALDFTPWLAETANIAFLGEVLGLDLEVAAQEKRVGRFAADIFCKDTATDSWVVMEDTNSSSQTHSHLGQLYLRGRLGNGYRVLSRISPKFCNEHRAALQWLNGMANGKSCRLFGVELEIGVSLVHLRPHGSRSQLLRTTGTAR